ncbi:MAG TPA: extracellular solute-binding protein [Firmicutes bacterium]|nr:extracellular solute-binding protein [Bacillota bacterium]
MLTACLVLAALGLVLNSTAQITGAAAQPLPVEEKRELSIEELRKEVNLFDLADLIDPFYEDVLEGWRAEGIKETEGISITINPTRYAAKYQTEEGEKIGLPSRVRTVKELDGMKGDILEWLDEETVLEWEVDIPVTGLYNISILYIPLPGKSSSVLRDLRIDGKYQFNEARRIAFHRTFIDDGRPKTDNQGNEIPPQQLEKRVWREVKLFDQQGMYSKPFLFYFTAGKHRISMTSIREPMAIAAIRVVSPEKLPTYAEYKAYWDSKGAKEVAYTTPPEKYEFEFAELKSSKTVRAGYGFNPTDSPPSQGKYKLNVFGQWRWRVGNDWATWKFTVPEDGYYKIGMKVTNNWSRRLPSARRIEIDGQVPFEELESYLFQYNKDPYMETLSDKNGNPYLIYLTKGEHELKMTAVVGPMAHTIRVLKDSVREMATLAMSIQMITGPSPDPNFEWKIHEQIPGLLTHLQNLFTRFREEVEWVRNIAPNNGLADQLEISAYILESLWRNPDIIPRRLAEFSQQESSLGTRILDLQWSPLEIDYFYVAPPAYQFPSVRTTALERLRLGISNFIMSFFNEYTNVGNVYTEKARGVDSEGNPILRLWIAYGREWATIIKEMIDDDFTPKTGIKVNVNVVVGGALDPSHNSALIMAMASGTAPDVAMGASSLLPVEFAIRGGAVNLNQFPDYEEIATRFRPGALIPYKFRGGDYALPDRQGFEMLFYRTDILGALGLQPPETWDDVRAMLPILQQYGMNFYYQGGYLPFLYQLGGDFYHAGGMYSALDTPQALAAFKEWCELYTHYRIPLAANFYNRMRTGEMPIGVANYETYIQLATAAPELTGWWEMKPIPGHVQEDGTINRMSGGLTAIGGQTGGGLSTVSVIFRDTPYPDESWELLKWWTSEPIQSRFGDELEAAIGMEARWNTANVQALKNLPWPRKDVEAVLEQWNWLKEQPIVPGGYYTGRHYTFAWNQVVLEGKNPREELEIAVKAIDRELRKKREEFGLPWIPRNEFFAMSPEEQAKFVAELSFMSPASSTDDDGDK